VSVNDGVEHLETPDTALCSSSTANQGQGSSSPRGGTVATVIETDGGILKRTCLIIVREGMGAEAGDKVLAPESELPSFAASIERRAGHKDSGEYHMSPRLPSRMGTEPYLELKWWL
jgi:hypothetical protein